MQDDVVAKGGLVVACCSRSRGVDTIEGVTIGSQRMQEGAPCKPAHPIRLGIWRETDCNRRTSLYVPVGANIIFDNEVFGRVDPNGPGWFMDEDVGLPRQREEL